MKEHATAMAPDRLDGKSKLPVIYISGKRDS